MAGDIHMDFIKLIEQYGPWVGFTALFIWNMMPTLQKWGSGHADKVTAQAKVIDATAEESLAEAETQRGMTRIAFQMLEERRAHDVRNDALNQSLTELKVELASVKSEYSEYRKGQTDSSTQLLTQIGLMEELRQNEKKQREQLEIEVNTLRGDMERALNKLNTVTTTSEARENEIQQLRTRNEELEREKIGFIERISTMETENKELKNRMEQAELRLKTLEDKPQSEEPLAEMPIIAQGEQP